MGRASIEFDVYLNPQKTGHPIPVAISCQITLPGTDLIAKEDGVISTACFIGALGVYRPLNSNGPIPAGLIV